MAAHRHCAAASTSAIATAPPHCEASDSTPLPPPLRKKPQRRWGIGAAKYYASVEAFNADLAQWNAEHTARAMLIAQRRVASERQREKKRSRDSSTRNEDAAFKAARVLRATARRHPMPTISRKEFHSLALLHKQVRAATPDQKRILFNKIRLQWQRMLQRGAQHYADSCSVTLSELCCGMLY